MMFRDARNKVLPAAARSMYTNAKASFEKGDLSKAQAQFGELIALLSEKELTGQTAFADLRMLADGFAKLTQQQIAEKAAAAAAAAATAAPSPAEVRAAAAAEASRVYSNTDTDVIAPVAIEQTIPEWVPPSANLRYQEFTGVLDVVIDENGSVASASMSQRVNIIYDQLLLSATKRWRYRPAVRQGKPVKYRKQLNIVLRPAAPGTEP